MVYLKGKSAYSNRSKPQPLPPPPRSLPFPFTHVHNFTRRFFPIQGRISYHPTVFASSSSYYYYGILKTSSKYYRSLSREILLSQRHWHILNVYFRRIIMLLKISCLLYFGVDALDDSIGPSQSISKHIVGQKGKSEAGLNLTQADKLIDSV